MAKPQRGGGSPAPSLSEIFPLLAPSDTAKRTFLSSVPQLAQFRKRVGVHLYKYGRYTRTNEVGAFYHLEAKKHPFKFYARTRHRRRKIKWLATWSPQMSVQVAAPKGVRTKMKTNLAPALERKIRTLQLRWVKRRIRRRRFGRIRSPVRRTSSKFRARRHKYRRRFYRRLFARREFDLRLLTRTHVHTHTRTVIRMHWCFERWAITAIHASTPRYGICCVVNGAKRFRKLGTYPRESTTRWRETVSWILNKPKTACCADVFADSD